MRAISGAVLSSEPCTLTEAHNMIRAFCSAQESNFTASDCAIYFVALHDAIKEHRLFLRCGGGVQEQRAAGHDAHGYEALVEGEMERWGRERDGDTKVSLGGPHGSVEETKVAVDAEEKKIKKKMKEEELVSEKKKAKKEREKDRVKLEEDAVEVKGQIANGGVVEQGVSDGEKKRKKKKHSKEEGGSKGVKEEEDKMAIDSDLNSEKKKKKKRGRGGDGDDDVQEQGEHKKKKQKKASRG